MMALQFYRLKTKDGSLLIVNREQITDIMVLNEPYTVDGKAKFFTHYSLTTSGEDGCQCCVSSMHDKREDAVKEGMMIALGHEQVLD